MLISFLLTLLSVAHIFEIPFMTFDPASFQKSNGSFCRASPGNKTTSQIHFPLKDSNETIETKPESLGKDVGQNVSQSSNATFPKLMLRILKNDLGLTADTKNQGPFTKINR